MGTIFVSHSSDDEEAAAGFAKRLRAHGYESLFLDFDPVAGIPAGRQWETEIYRQLRRADAVIFLATAASVGSPWCFAELAIAKSLGKPIFPVGLGVTAHPLLSAYQWVDAMRDEELSFKRLWTSMKDFVDPLTAGWQGDSPYPGLRAYSADLAGVFFGRTAETVELCDRLRAMTLGAGSIRALAIVGASGSGKSSLVRAGVVPRLVRSREWVAVAPFEPREHGATPLEAMCRKLARSLHGREEWHSIHERILADASQLRSIARDLIDQDAGVAQQVLLVLDQAEGLLRCSPADREAFLGPLLAAVQDEAPVTFVMTMRSEFIPAALREPSLSMLLLAQSSFLLGPLERPGMREVIVGPARMAGAEFAEDLSETILDDVKGPDALPLLAFTLERLYAERGPDGVISTASYEHMGRVEGALRSQADQTFAALSRRGLADHVLPTLVKFADLSETGETLRRPLARKAFSDSEKVIVDAFIEARLLKSTDEGHGPTVEITHEALLRAWDPLRNAIESAGQALRLRAELERAAREWDRQGRAPGYLVHRGRVDELRGLGAQRTGDLSAEAAAYVRACIEAREQETAAQDRVRREREARALSVLALAALDQTPQRALLLGVEAVERVHLDGQASIAEADDAIAQIATRVRGQPVPDLTPGLKQVQLAPDGRYAARLGDGELRVLPLGEHGAAGAASVLALPELGPYPRVGWAGPRVLVEGASEEGAMTLVFSDTATGRFAEVARLSGQPIGASCDGAVLALRARDRSTELFRVGDAVQRFAQLPAHQSSEDVVFSNDGRRFVMCDDTGGVVYRGVDDGDVHVDFRVDAGLTYRFSPDGRWLFSSNTTPGSGGSGARSSIWSLSDGLQAQCWHSSGGRNVAIATFSPDSRWLAFVGWNDMYQDEYIRLFRLEPGQAPPAVHTLRQIEEINSLAYSADGHWIVSASRNDDNAFAWDLRALWGIEPECAERALTPIPLGGHGRGVSLLSLAATNSTIVTLSRDGILRQFELEKQTSKRGSPLEIWRVAPSSPTTLLGHDGPISDWAMSADEQTVLTVADGERPRLWHLPARGRPLPPDVVGEARRLAGRALTANELDVAHLQEIRGEVPPQVP
jgi:hypothetical protein